MTDLEASPDVSAERVRRMARSLQAEAPTEAEVRAARQRFLTRTTRRSRPPLTGYLMALGAGAAGMLLLLRIFGPPRPHEQISVSVGPETVSLPTAVGQGALAVPAPAYFERNGQRQAARAGLHMTLPPGDTGAVVVGESRTELSGPAVIEFHRRAGTTTGWQVRVTRPEDRTAPHRNGERGAQPRSRPADEPLPPGSTDSKSWEQVARALREEDPTAAEKALRRLATKPEAETREAAELALAQLQVSQGRNQEARATLQVLAQQASADIVRKRAADLLANIE